MTTTLSGTLSAMKTLAVAQRLAVPVLIRNEGPMQVNVGQG